LRLLLVRHGETEGNVSRRLQGADDPLTDRGRRQAEEIAAHLSGREDVAALYASPYRRAFDTARPIGEALGLEPEPRPALAELDVGDAAGYRFEAWIEEFPGEAERFRTEGVDYSWPGGESGRDLAARTEGEIDRIIRAHGGEDGAVVVVSHGGALAWIIAHLLGEPDGEWPYSYARLENCSVTEAEISPNGEGPAEFLYTNEVGHLSPDPDEEAATGRDPVD
jgi:broad specificity phosphatase PhoE